MERYYPLKNCLIIFVLSFILIGCVSTQKTQIRKKPGQSAEHLFSYQEKFGTLDGWKMYCLLPSGGYQCNKDKAFVGLGNGTFKLSNEMTRSSLTYSKRFKQIDEMGDWDYQAAIRKTGGKDSGTYGISIGSGYFAGMGVRLLNCTPTGYCRIDSIVKDRVVNLRSYKNVKGYRKGNDINTFRILKRGSSLHFYVNDTLLQKLPHRNYYNPSHTLGIVLRAKHVDINVEKISFQQTKSSNIKTAPYTYYKQLKEREQRDAREKTLKKGMECLKRPLKGNYLVCDDDLVLDTRNNLMWMRYNHAEKTYKDTKKTSHLTWDKASAYVKTANRTQRYGFNDWRLPSKQELITTQVKRSKCYKWNESGFSMKAYQIADAFHCEKTDRKKNHDWSVWAGSELTENGELIRFGDGYSAKNTTSGTVRLVRTGPMDLSVKEHYRMFGDVVIEKSNLDFLEKSNRAYSAGLKEQALQLFEKAIVKQKKAVFQKGGWLKRLEQTEILSKLFEVNYDNLKNWPLYWLDYARLANRFRQPALTLQAVSQLKYTLQPKHSAIYIPSEHLRDYGKAAIILEASALVQLGKIEEAFGIFITEEIGTEEQTLYFLTHNGDRLFENKDKLATATGFKKERLVNHAVEDFQPIPFINVFTGKMVSVSPDFSPAIPKVQKTLPPTQKAKGRVLD